MKTETETVWRMEDAEGDGPFTPEKFDPVGMAAHVPWLKVEPGTLVEQLLYGIQYKALPDDTHPHHLSDVLGAKMDPEDPQRFIPATVTQLPGDHWRVGTKDKDQLLHWFPAGSLDWFTHQGFKAVEYRVPKEAVHEGTYQLVFDRDLASKVKEIEPKLLPLLAS